MLRKVS